MCFLQLIRQIAHRFFIIAPVVATGVSSCYGIFFCFILLTLAPSIIKDERSFAYGTKGAEIEYDPFFKYVFDPAVNPERLEDFIGLCLGENVEIQRFGYFFPGPVVPAIPVIS